MIELKVLAVKSDGRATEYKISPSPVMLGGKDSYGVEALHLTVPVEWEGCALRVTFTPELCEGITRSVVGDNVVEIDAAITAVPVGKLTVEATNDENQRYFTHSVPYVVYDHEAVGKDIPAPGSDLWQQFVDDTLANANAAKAARDAAQAAEANALQDRDEAREAAQNAAIFADEAAKSAENAKTAADEAEEAAESLVPFYATYGVTSYADVLAAYKSGRSVYCVYYSYVAPLNVVNEGAGAIWFYMHNSTTQCGFAVTSENNKWLRTEHYNTTFYATYEKTPFAEIEAAYRAGREVRVIYNVTCIGCMMLINLDEETRDHNYAMFELVDSNGTIRNVKISRSNEWTHAPMPYVKNTDYASNSVHGVVRYDAYYGITGGTAGSAGVPIPVWASNEEINAKNERRFINAKNLDYALKKSLTTNTETLTTEEKTKAQEWLGIKKATNEAKPYTLVERSANGVIYTGTPTEAKHATTKEYVDGLAVDRSKGVVAFEADGTQVAIPWAYNTAGGSIARRLGNGTLWVETPDVDKAAANKAYVDGKVCGHYTTLRREGKMLDVICHGLVNGETYTVRLFTATRRRGNAFGGWRHPANENTGEGFTGKGYARLAIQRYAGAKKMDTTAAIYPEIPEWMPRYGILQTEWSFTAADDTHTLTIDLAEFILPMLKPEADNFEAFTSGAKCQMIGVARGTMAPLLMQFRVERGSTGAIGESKNTLRIGEKIRTDADGELPLSVSLDNKTGKYRANGLYISVV